MPLSREVRWFHPGPVPDSVRDWFTSLAGPMVVEPRGRADVYLGLGGTTDLGVKLRGGRAEVKRLHEENGEQILHPGFDGRVQTWAKWVGELPTPEWPSDVGPGPSWVVVRKARCLRKYSTSSGDGATAIEPNARAVDGCNLELTALRVGADGHWWTIGLEAFAESDDHERIERAFRLTATHALAARGCPPQPLAASLSYPELLARLAAPSPA